MKKLILSLVLMVGFTLNAQVAKVATPLNFETGWFKNYIGLATDTLGTVTATTWSYEIPVNKFDGLFYVSKIKLSDKTTGANGVCTVKFQGKYFDSDSYTDITTVKWTGVNSTDTTITFSNVSTKIYYPYIRQLVTNTSGKSKVEYSKTIIKR
jgi:hypothetical protein